MSGLQYRKLNEGEIEAEMATLPTWRVDGGKIARTFHFDRYKDGVVFATAVAFLADKLNHHPDLSIGYGRVEISLNTHDVGGLSPYDFELARQIDSLAS